MVKCTVCGSKYVRLSLGGYTNGYQIKCLGCKQVKGHTEGCHSLCLSTFPGKLLISWVESKLGRKLSNVDRGEGEQAL